MQTKIRHSNAQDLAKAILFGLVTITAAACATNTAPTHRWASTEEADQARYVADQTKCRQVAQLGNTQRELDSSSTAFQAYKTCMNNNGYVLTAYNE